MKSAIIASGILGWHRYERQTDRYGAIHLRMDLLFFDGESTADDYITFPPGLDGLHGELSAEVLETRESTHLGDVARNLQVSSPQKGETIVLGTGTVFIDSCVDGRFPVEEERAVSTIGLIPDDGREFNWLIPESLYRLHDQTVLLRFRPSRSSDVIDKDDSDT